MKKYQIIAIVAIVLVVIVSVATYQSEVDKTTLGSSGLIGAYKVLKSGLDQKVIGGPAILHSFMVQKAGDSVAIGDVEYSATASTSSQLVFNFTIGAAGTVLFPVETLFEHGIMANVTSTNGIIFIFSPR